MNPSRKKRSGADRRDAERRAQRRPPGAAPDRRLDLHNPAELIGFAVDSPGGALGRIESLRVEEDSWGVTEIVVLPAGRVRGRRRLILPLNSVARVDRRRRRIYVHAVDS